MDNNGHNKEKIMLILDKPTALVTFNKKRNCITTLYFAERFSTYYLNGVYNKKFGGSKVGSNVRYGSGTVVIEVYLHFTMQFHCKNHISVSVCNRKFNR